jgi:hypothetical protein
MVTPHVRGEATKGLEDADGEFEVGGWGWEWD